MGALPRTSIHAAPHVCHRAPAAPPAMRLFALRAFAEPAQLLSWPLAVQGKATGGDAQPAAAHRQLALRSRRKEAASATSTATADALAARRAMHTSATTSTSVSLLVLTASASQSADHQPMLLQVH